MNIESLVENIYDQIGAPCPAQVLFYSSIDEAFADYNNWSKQVERVMTCYWPYQFPMVIPSSYWASYHLKKDGYRLDVKRSPNENGCFVYGKYLHESANIALTQDQYDKICKDLKKHKFDNRKAEKLVDSIYEKYETELELFDEYLDKEDPTCQIGVDEFIFLGNFEWLQSEIWFLKNCKEQFGVPINEPMYEILREIQQSQKLFLTFSNLVVVIEIA